MIDGLKPYSEYKNAKMPWLGKVPSHWTEKRAKYFYREVDERSTTGEEELMSVSHKTGVTPRKKNVTMFMAENNIGHKICRPDDLAINTMWAYMAALGVARQVGVVSPSYGVYRPTGSGELHPEYVDRLLRVEDYKSEYLCRSTGVTSSRLRLYAEEFLRIPILSPPPEEQAAIVRFLDHADRRIRRFIRTKRQLIALLNEQKQAIIHQAVTRGLDPDVRFKPSGVESLGDVPEHWEVRRLRHAAELRVSNVDKHTKEAEVPVRLCNYVDVYKHDCITNEIEFMRATATPDEVERFRLDFDDVLITKDSEAWDDIGVPSLVANTAPDLVCGYHLALLRPRKQLIDGRYLLRALQSRAVALQFHVSATGVTRYGLSHSAIKSVCLPVPPLSEQLTIAQHLDEATTGSRLAIERAHHEIQLLREYRTRLIADVVTGKLDVREAAAELPDETDEPEAADDMLLGVDEVVDDASLDVKPEEVEA